MCYVVLTRTYKIFHYIDNFYEKGRNLIFVIFELRLYSDMGFFSPSTTKTIVSLAILKTL